MNQGIAFARTIRALEADDFRRSKIGLLIALILLAAWIWWMFAARVPQNGVRMSPAAIALRALSRGGR